MVKAPTAEGLSFLREIVGNEREHFARLQYAIETRADDLSTLYRLAAAAAEDLKRSEAHLKRKEDEFKLSEGICHNNEN